MSEIVLPGRVNEVDDQRCYTQDEHQHYLERGDNANINNSTDNVIYRRLCAITCYLTNELTKEINLNGIAITRNFLEKT